MDGLVRWIEVESFAYCSNCAGAVKIGFDDDGGDDTKGDVGRKVDDDGVVVVVEVRVSMVVVVGC